MNRWTTEARTFHKFLLVSQLDPTVIRARIREARLAAGLTQQDLADLLELHKRTIENYEKVRTPDFAALNTLARVLNRPVEWFLWGDEVITREERDAEERESAQLLREVLDRLLRVEQALAPAGQGEQRLPEVAGESDS